MAIRALNAIHMYIIFDDGQLKWALMLRVDLGPITELCETTKGQVRHRLWEQWKVSGSLSEGSVPSTQKVHKDCDIL